MIASHTIVFRHEPSSASCDISTPFVWERLLGIPILIFAFSFAEVRSEAEVVSDVCNGVIRTYTRVCAPLVISQWDTAAPPISFFGFESV